jgi:DNA polymerase I-like protein with 3'-5' exonuclease and polymerase domains
MVGATLLRIPLEEMIERKKDPNDNVAYLARQTGKVANFGLAGGLGWRALIKQARSLYGVHLEETSAKALIAAWHLTWPEFREYFAWINQQCRSGFAWVTQFCTERQRGHIPYTEACNTFFQGLGADVAKAGLWALQRACYVDRGNPLYGCRTVNFIHDEYLVEVPDDGALMGRANALERTVIVAANVYLPDVPVTAKALATRRWSKLAKRIVNSDGTLGVWEWDGAK